MGVTRGNRVHGTWHRSFHTKVEEARQYYSRQLGKNLSMPEVTQLWGEGKITKFKIPPLKLRTEYARKKR